MPGKKNDPVNDNTFYFPGQKGAPTETGDPLSDGEEEETDNHFIEFKVRVRTIIYRSVPYVNSIMSQRPFIQLILKLSEQFDSSGQAERKKTDV